MLEHRSEGEETSAARPAADARSAEVRAPVFAHGVTALQRRVGVADASAVDGLARRSPAPSPGRGAQLASTAGACGGAFASDVSRPFSDRAIERAPLAPGGLT